MTSSPRSFAQPATAAMDADVLIIGSGAGGATTATVLAEAGLDVLIVEEGDWVEQGEVVPFSLEQMDRQYRAGGVTVAIGLPSIAYTEGRCAGGGTEVNSGLYWRPPGDVLQRWRDQFRIADFDPDELLAIADEVENDINVGPVPGAYTEPSEVLRRGADALGWRNGEIPRWMTYPAAPTRPGVAPTGERQSMTRTYLPRAIRAGARLAVGCRVHRLVSTGGRAAAADTTLSDGTRGTITFRHVFVCGGAIQTPALLQRSGIRGHIGRTLAVHPTVKLAARFADELNVPDDVPVHQVKEFAPHLSFGGSASNPGLVALSLLDQWSSFRQAVTEWRNISVYYAAITSEGLGRVRSFPHMKDPIVTYGLTHRDRELLRSGLGRLALLMLEAGALEVYPSFKGAPPVKNRRDLATMMSRFAATKASVMTVHLCSTVPMGELEGRTGANSFGLVHGCSNIYVNDASLLPTAPGVNPQASVMAFAIRNARRFVASGGRRA
ncbi:MAG: GMC family oxidoreductase [Ilumatobacteraceae bacterium]